MSIPPFIDSFIKSLYPDTSSIFAMSTTGGSNRQYFRFIFNNSHSLVAVYSENIAENKAFFSFSKTFEIANIKVPHILYIHPSQTMYIIEDLGDTLLFDLLVKRQTKELSPDILEICKKAINQLVKLQFVGAEKLDYKFAYPVEFFDKTAMMWDLNYFKYCLLKPSNIFFNEPALENDFNSITDILLSNSILQSFVYRDFQSRNIMIVSNKLINNDIYFIDYQGGRRGLCLYDLASFISQAKADFCDKDAETISDYYFECISNYVSIDKNTFHNLLNYTLLLRIIQTLGAYGFRGIIEKKEHFLNSLKPGIINLNTILYKVHNLPELNNICNQLINKYLNNKSTNCLNQISSKPDKLTLTINSFSYKKSDMPKDEENGGGFVFDCRGLPNPHRIPELRPFSGNSEIVSKYLDDQPIIHDFIKHVIGVTEISVNNYIKRNFANLMISFGCTGGKHRSVYCAEKIADYYRNNYNIIVILNHLCQKDW